MKNRDFRLFDYANLPEMTKELSQSLLETIGSNLYDNQQQKNLFKERIVTLFGSKCAYCGAILDNNSSEQVDHYIPMDDTNKNDPKNLLLACFLCNNSKRKRFFSSDLYPYNKNFSIKFKRDSFGFIIPANSDDLEAASMAKQLHFSSISRSITYIFLLIDYLSSLYEKKSDDRHNQLLISIEKFRRKLSNCSKLICLREKIDDR